MPEIHATLVIGQWDNPHDPDQEPHEAVVAGYEPVLLQLERFKHFLNIDLTLMTVEEITSFKQIVDLAVERGLKVAQQLDDRAQEILESGSKTVPLRAFRMKPTIVIRHLEIGGIDDEEA
jgi:hypothetical protein